MIKISFVIPALNEESNIHYISENIIKEINGLFDYEIVFVDDGSTDKTIDELRQLNSLNNKIHFISFSKNFGHQQALKAGIDYAQGDCVITMDADMQHPPALINPMINKWLKEGYDIVYTKRNDDKQLPFLKRKTSDIFYFLINKIADVKIERGAADFRLLDKKVVDIVSKLNDPYLFMRGLIPWMGFKHCCINYAPSKRYAGETKYSYKKMFAFALSGITSFSIRPLHLATIIGLLISLLSFFYGVYAVIIFFFNDKVISGWASVLTSILFVGGIQLLILGIIGEYIGKIYMHLKNRPTYIIRESSKIK